MAGDDSFLPYAADEVFPGGDGTDSLVFRGTTAVAIALDYSFEADGAVATDLWTEIENVIGSGRADYIRGDTGKNSLEGWAGADTIDGARGADKGTGGAGKDRDAHFIFRTKDTTRRFDSDGKGGDGPALVADLQAGAKVTAKDIVLV